jgi:L-fuconolactonase
MLRAKDETMTEAILEPELPIIDPHHHLWDLRARLAALSESSHPFVKALTSGAYYTFDALHADVTSGHNVIGTVYMECGAFYRSGASDALKVVGEIEVASGVAAQSASGLYGQLRLCAGIVGHADLRLGDEAADVLDALAEAGRERFKGIRHIAAWDADPEVLGPAIRNPPGLYADSTFRAGFRHLAPKGLTFDAWVLEPQLGEVTDLARAFPDTSIVLDHCGTPLNVASYHGKLHERFDTWRESIRELARCPNVSVKLGGLAMAYCGMPERGPLPGISSEVLAAMWRPYIETCIEAFGPARAMFESNFPVDRWGGDYITIWNAFKRLTHGASADEKRALYAGTAARVYQIEGLI